MSIDSCLRRRFASYAECPPRLSRLLLGLLVFLGCVAVAAGLQAGEAIQFAPGKSKVAPELDLGQSKGKASGPERRARLSVGSELQGELMPSLSSPRRSRSEEKKLKNEQLEKKNWMILDRGDLQQKDEEGTELGVRDYSIEGERTAGDIWFGPNRSKLPTGASARANRGPSGASRAPSPSAGRQGPEDKPTEETPRTTAQTQGQQITASVREVEAQTSLASDQKDGGMRDLFSGRPASNPTDNRRDESGFRPAIGGNSQPSLGRGYGLGRESGPSLGGGPSSSPILDGRRSAISGPAGEPPSLSRGFGGGIGGPSFGSDLRGPFSSPSSGFNNNNNQRHDFAPGSSRSTFETPTRR